MTDTPSTTLPSNRNGLSLMKQFNVGDHVEVLLNVGNCGPSWVYGVYRGVYRGHSMTPERPHIVYFSDVPEQRHVANDCIRSKLVPSN